jgi:hypothetical protein
MTHCIPSARREAIGSSKTSSGSSLAAMLLSDSDHAENAASSRGIVRAKLLRKAHGKPMILSSQRAARFDYS